VKNIILLFMVLLVSTSAYCWHILGGEMNYKSLGGDNYQIKLKLYRDCTSTTPFDDPASITIYDNNNVLISTVSIGFPGASSLNYDTTLCSVFGICIESCEYITELNLPSIAGYYIIAYQRCCRNAAISNLADPQNTGLTIICMINQFAMENGNSSPEFIHYPAPNICLNEIYAFDHSAIDTDDDSLIYYLCTPLSGADAVNPQPVPAPPPPYAPIVFGASYSYLQPLGPSSSITIDSIDGSMQVSPAYLGSFLVGVCVEEYRGGNYLGSHLRDFEFMVGEYHVGVEAVNNKYHCSIFPNPTTSSLSILCAGISGVYLECYDVYGQIVFTTTLHSKFYEVNTEQWQSGIYFLHFRNEDELIYNTSVIVQ